MSARETRAETAAEAERVLTRLLNRVDEHRSPRTEVTVSQLVDRWLEVIDIEKKTRAGYVGKIEKHIRPTIGRLPVGKVIAETLDTLYARLRRCRDHCGGRKFVQHRTTHEHTCDEHSPRRKCQKDVTGDQQAECRWCDRVCRPHVCVPLAGGRRVPVSIDIARSVGLAATPAATTRAWPPRVSGAGSAPVLRRTSCCRRPGTGRCGRSPSGPRARRQLCRGAGPRRAGHAVRVDACRAPRAGVRGRQVPAQVTLSSRYIAAPDPRGPSGPHAIAVATDVEQGPSPR